MQQLLLQRDETASQVGILGQSSQSGQPDPGVNLLIYVKLLVYCAASDKILFFDTKKNVNKMTGKQPVNSFDD